MKNNDFVASNIEEAVLERSAEDPEDREDALRIPCTEVEA
jgi:hypothetical protein